MNQHRFSELSSLLPNVSRETWADFEIYEKTLIQWQKKINLIGYTTLSDIWHRHLLDSVQLFPLAQTINNLKINHWLDVGSGGGFPGLILAILIKYSGQGRITLIESNGKKAAFLRMMVAKLHLPALVINQRIESSYHLIQPAPDVITARALADLPDLLKLIAPFFGAQTFALLQKGRNFLQETELAQQDWYFDLTNFPSITHQQAVILIIRNLRPKL